MIFAPPVILLSRNLGKIDAIPYHKPLALMLSGWLISLVYSVVYSYNDYGYTFVFDIYLLLGFCIAYLVYFMLKLEYLNVDRLMRYIMFSGLFFIGMVVVMYVVNGYAPQIFKLNGRFGMLVNVNSNLLSLYIGMTLPYAFFSALFETRSTAKKIFFYTISVIYLYVLVIAGSRGGFLGLAAIIIYFLWLKRSIKWVLSTLAGFVVVFFTIGPKYIARLFAPSAAEMMSDLGRVEFLKVAFKILRDNYFFFGIGMGNYGKLKMQYGFPVWFSPMVEGLSSHNIYTEMWLGWGIFGLLGWLIFNACIVSALLRNKEERYNSTAKGIALAMISFLLYGFVDSNIGNFSVMFTYFSLLGTGLFIIAQTNYASNESNNIRVDLDQSKA
jgi:O-antigen ligase